MEKEFCKNLIQRWKELKAKGGFVQDPRKSMEPSSITPDEMKEFDKTMKELKENCLEYLSPEEQWEIEQYQQK